MIYRTLPDNSSRWKVVKYPNFPYTNVEGLWDIQCKKNLKNMLSFIIIYSVFHNNLFLEKNSTSYNSKTTKICITQFWTLASKLSFTFTFKNAIQNTFCKVKASSLIYKLIFKLSQ